MPNAQGFNLLGPEVACIDCDARGLVADWPLKRMTAHRDRHVKEMARARDRQRRQQQRDALRLAAQAARENEMAYGGGK